MSSTRMLMCLLDHGVWLLLLFVVCVFAGLSEDFATWSNFSNVFVQAASTMIVATGMTFVLLTAGVDLSVGAIMFLSAAVAGKLAVAGSPFAACVLGILAVAMLFATINAWMVTRLGIVPFVVTLGTLYMGRGIALWLTETRAINLPATFLAVGSSKAVGVPVPILIAVAAVGVSQCVLTFTVFGRHVLAIGHDHDVAKKAGIQTQRVLFSVYVLAGLFAGIGALISLGQLGTVSPTFGEGREFTAIAAAVVGGTSLFGGRGTVFPGTVLGALLTQTVENGLVLLNADPYLYPMIISSIIFTAVLLDGLRNRLLEACERRPIFRE